MKVHPVTYYVIAGCFGGIIGATLVTRLGPFWSWFAAGLAVSVTVALSNTRLRRKIAVVSLACVAAALATGGVASLIYRFM